MLSLSGLRVRKLIQGLGLSSGLGGRLRGGPFPPTLSGEGTPGGRAARAMKLCMAELGPGQGSLAWAPLRAAQLMPTQAVTVSVCFCLGL